MFEKDAFKIEKTLNKKRPIIAKPKPDLLEYDQSLIKSLGNDKWNEFDIAVFHPENENIYCVFYDKVQKETVLISIFDLKFQNLETQKKVMKFYKKYTQQITNHSS